MEARARTALAVLERQPVEVLAALAHALQAVEQPDELDAGLWGPLPTPAHTGRAAASAAKALARQRSELLARSLTRGEAAQVLGVSAQAVSEMLAAGRLVGLRQGREWRIPAWQFAEEGDKEARGGTLSGLAPLVEVFPAGPVALTRWVLAPHADLDGGTPRELLARGDVEAVVALAGSLTAAGW